MLSKNAGVTQLWASNGEQHCPNYVTTATIIMPKANFDSSQEQLLTELNSLTSVEIQQLIAQLQHSHNLRYKTLNLEFWALASTMDTFIPGFWSRFLANRRTALQQFIKQKRSPNSPTS